MEHMFSIEIQAEYLERMQDDYGSIMEHTTYVLFSFKPLGTKNASFLNLNFSRIWFHLEVDRVPINKSSDKVEWEILNMLSRKCNAPLETVEKNNTYIGFDTNQDIKEIIQIFKEILNDFGYI